MSSGVQYYVPRNQQPIQAVRFDGTNRSQIEQWTEGLGLSTMMPIPPHGNTAWTPAWVVYDPAFGPVVVWWSDSDFIAAFKPVTIDEARAQVQAAEETT